MTSQRMISDAERITIESEILALLKQQKAAAERVDIEGWLPLLSDVHQLGYISNGQLVPTSQAVGEAYRQVYSQYERQENIEEPQYRVAVLAQDAAVATAFIKSATHYKDGKTEEIEVARTCVFAKIDGQWKFIHIHQFIS